MNNNTENTKFLNLIKIETYAFSGLLFILGIHSIQDYYGIVNGVDEWGYLSNAFYMAGMGTNDLSHMLSYYSYGYSIIIVPLVKLIENPIILYRTIIILNTTFIVLTFYITVKTLDLIGIRGVKNPVISFCGCSYVSCFINSKYVFSESVLVFIFSVLVYVFLLLEMNYSLKKIIMLELLLVAIIFVHQRTIGVLAAGVILIVLTIKRRGEAVDFVTLFIILGGYIVYLYYKTVIVQNVYLNTGLVSNNDFSGQLGKVFYLFSISGITDFVQGLMAKLFYFCFSSCFIGVFGLLFALGETVRRGRYTGTYFFVLLSFLFTMIIQEVFLIVPNRYDLVIYGRYIEFMYPILICTGFVSLQNITKCKYYVLMFLISIVGYYSGVSIWDRYSLKYQTSYLSPGMYLFFKRIDELNEAMLVYLVLSGVFLTILFYCNLLKNRKLVNCILLLLVIVNNLLNISVLEADILKDQIYLMENYSDIIETLKKVDGDIYFFPKNLNANRARQMQFLCNNHSFKNTDTMAAFSDGDILITSLGISEVDAENVVGVDLKKVQVNYMFQLWESNSK